MTGAGIGCGVGYYYLAKASVPGGRRVARLVFLLLLMLVYIAGGAKQFRSQVLLGEGRRRGGGEDVREKHCFNHIVRMYFAIFQCDAFLLC